MNKLADRIKLLRVENNLTQEDFGELFGIVKSTVSLYESGKSTPADEIKTKISERFNVSMDWLLGLTNERKSVDQLKKNNMLNYNSKTQKIYDIIARAKDLPQENIEQISDALEALLKHHQEKQKKPDQGTE